MTALPHPATAGTTQRTGRITGIDMARAVAILGMVMVHFGPFEPDTTTVAGQFYRFSYGRASVLFVLLAGVGISLLFRARPPEQAWLRIGWRALVFFPLGVVLQALDTPVAVILQFYALYYLVGAAAAMLPTKCLWAVTVIWAVVGPLVFLSANDPTLAGRGTATVLSDPGQVLVDLLIDGFYPLITWAPPLLVGVLVGRTDLRDPATRFVLTVGGLLVAVAVYGGGAIARANAPAEIAGSSLLLSEGHSGAPLNVVGASAVAVTVLGLCLLVADVLPRLSWPWVAAGQMALTVYVGHLLVLDVVPEWLEARDSVAAAAAKVVRFQLVVLAGCVAWLTRFRRGPLETLLTLPFRGWPSDQGRRRTAGDRLQKGEWWEDRPIAMVTSPQLPSRAAPRPSPQSIPTSTSSSGTTPPKS